MFVSYFQLVPLFLTTAANAATILFIPMHASETHSKSMLPLAEALGAKGHEVAMWLPRADDVASKIHTKLVKILRTEISEKLQSVNEETEEIQNILWAMKGMDPVVNVIPWYFMLIQCVGALKENLSDILRLLAKNWDLFITDTACAPCHFVFGYLSPNTSRIPYVTSYYSAEFARSRGGPTHVGTYAEWVQFSFNHRNFMDRFHECIEYGLMVAASNAFALFMANVYLSNYRAFSNFQKEAKYNIYRVGQQKIAL